MSREAWERAVEAGAEALCRAVHPGRFSEKFDYWRSEWIKPATKEAFRKEAADCLRAAFPILAEEFAGIIDKRVKILRDEDADWLANLGPEAFQPNEDRADELETVARSLRARIEQMKEMKE
jgi:hypothetical protein